MLLQPLNYFASLLSFSLNLKGLSQAINFRRQGSELVGSLKGSRRRRIGESPNAFRFPTEWIRKGNSQRNTGDLLEVLSDSTFNPNAIILPRGCHFPMGAWGLPITGAKLHRNSPFGAFNIRCIQSCFCKIDCQL